MAAPNAPMSAQRGVVPPPVQMGPFPLNPEPECSAPVALPSPVLPLAKYAASAGDRQAIMYPETDAW
jgi:hypothetical protein